MMKFMLFAQLRTIFQVVGAPFDEFLNILPQSVYCAGFVRLNYI